MKFLSFLLFLVLFISCKQEVKKDTPSKSAITKNVLDTIIVKSKNILKNNFETDTYSKFYTYYWLINNDTLDFKVIAREYLKDSTFNLAISHKKPILFKTVLNNINKCTPLIEEDFMKSKLKSFYFKPPIYYKDIAFKLTEEYDEKFGEKVINHQQLNEFLIDSELNTKLNTLLSETNKTVERYSIEKFHLLNKKDYHYYLPNKDIENYPDNMLNGLGIYVMLSDNSLKLK